MSEGDEAFAFFTPLPRPLPACSQREACIDSCLDDRGRDTFVPPCCGEPCTGRGLLTQAHECEELCEQEASDDCLPRPEDDHRYGIVKLSPWGHTITLAKNANGEISVPSSELAMLRGDRQACEERFGDWSDLLSP